MLWNEETSTLNVIDWEFPKVSKGVEDLAVVLLRTDVTEQPAELLEAKMKLYYETLVECGVTQSAYPFE